MGGSKRGAPWLLLIHQLPPKPDYFRVKIWRKLGALGAVAIKNSVYVLPATDSCLESFQWISREILQGGGEATTCEAVFIEGLTDSRIESLFNQARDLDYKDLADEARGLSKKVTPRASLKEAQRRSLAAELARLRRRLQDVSKIDYFGSSGRETAEALIEQLGTKMQAAEPGSVVIGRETLGRDDLKGRTWITRRGIHVDRIASAWLIRRFIDPQAVFKYVAGKGYEPRKGELRFDMFQAEFTHEGDHCTFEVLLERTNLTGDFALKQIAEITHNIDLRDGKFQRDDVRGVEQVINGICLGHPADTERLRRGAELFDDLYEAFKLKCKSGERK